MDAKQEFLDDIFRILKQQKKEAEKQAINNQTTNSTLNGAAVGVATAGLGYGAASSAGYAIATVNPLIGLGVIAGATLYSRMEGNSNAKLSIQQQDAELKQKVSDFFDNMQNGSYVTMDYDLRQACYSSPKLKRLNYEHKRKLLERMPNTDDAMQALFRNPNYSDILSSYPLILQSNVSQINDADITKAFYGDSKLKSLSFETKRGIIEKMPITNDAMQALFKNPHYSDILSSYPLILQSKVSQINDADITKAFYGDSKLKSLSFDNRQAMIDAMPATPENISSLLEKKDFAESLPQHYATLHCKIMQITNTTKREYLLDKFNGREPVAKYIKATGPEDLKINTFKEALRFAQTDEDNAIYPLYHLHETIKYAPTEQMSKWDFLDSKCEKQMSDIITKNILVHKPSRDFNMSSSDMLYFRKDLEKLTKDFSNYHSKMEHIDVKNNPDNALRATLSYAKEYEKEVRKAVNRTHFTNSKAFKEYDDAKEEHEKMCNKYHAYLKKKEENAKKHELDPDKQAFADLESQEPAELKKSRETLQALDEKYSKRPFKVQAGLNIARFVTSNLDFISNKFLSTAANYATNPATSAYINMAQYGLNMSGKAFNIVTGITVEQFLNDKLDDFSVTERVNRLKKIFHNNDDMSDVTWDTSIPKNFTKPTPMEQSIDDATKNIPLPQDKIDALFDKLQKSDDGYLAKMSHEGLETLTLLALKNVFDDDVLPSKRFTLLNQLITKAPDSMFQGDGFFTGRKLQQITQLACEVLDLGFDDIASELMGNLLPKISMRRYNASEPKQLDMYETLSKMTELSIKLAEQKTEKSKKPLMQLLDFTDRDLLNAYKDTNRKEIIDPPVLSKIDALVDLSLKDLDKNGYDILNRLTKVIEISKKYEHNGHETLFVPSLFYNNTSRIFDVLIQNSNRPFRNGAKDMIATLLKHCSHKDFSSTGRLQNDLLKLVSYTKGLKPEELQKLENTDFGKVFKKCRGDLDKMSRVFDKPALDKKSEQLLFEFKNTTHGFYLSKMPKDALEKLTEMVFQAIFDENTPQNEQFTLLNKLVDKLPNEMFQGDGFFTGKNLKKLTKVICYVLKKGSDDTASELLGNLLPKISMRHYNASESKQYDLYESLAEMTELSIKLAEQKTEKSKKPLMQLLDFTDRDLLNAYKDTNRKEIIDPPVLSKIDALVDLSLKDLDKNGYDILNRLIRVIRISKKYEHNGHKTLSVPNLFYNNASRIFDVLINNSNCSFKNDAKDMIATLLKHCLHKDFSSTGRLKDDLEKIMIYATALNAEEFEKIKNTDFGKVFKKCRGDLDKMSRVFDTQVKQGLFNKPKPITRQDSIDSLDSNPDVARMPIAPKGFAKFLPRMPHFNTGGKIGKLA